MGMLSYKQYKILNENLDSVIGISRPTNIGLVQEAPQLFGMMSKKMSGDVPPGLKGKKPGMGAPDVDPDDMGGGDMGDKDPDDMGDDDMGDKDPDDMGDDDGDDMGGDDDMGDDEDGDEGGDDEGAGMGGPMGGPMGGAAGPGGGDMGMGGPGMGGPEGGMMGKKKPMPPKMMKKAGYMSYMKKEASDPQDKAMKAQNAKNNADDQNLNKGGEKCCDKCGTMMNKKSKKSSKMTKEQREFNDSLMRQAGSLKFKQDELGYWVPVTEDVLIPAENDPQPGQVGHAPTQYMGMGGGVSQSKNFQEWVTKNVKKK